MWSTFFIGIVFCVAVLYTPGFLQAHAMQLRPSLAFVFAPIISLFEYVALGTIFGLLGIQISWVTIIAPPLLLSIAAYIIVFLVKRSQNGSAFTISWIHIILYVLFGLTTVAYYYVRCLEGPESFVQLFDNAYHLNIIETFVETHSFSILQASLFPSIPIATMSDISFYPAAWHIIAALCVEGLGISVAMAQNIVNVVFAGIIFPASMCAFISKLFQHNKKIIPFGALCTMAFTAFPWGFLAAGPLYSNFASFAILPAVMYAFLCMIDCISKNEMMRFVLLLLVGIWALLFTQPNSIFTAIIILSPYCSYKIYVRVKAKYTVSRAVLGASSFVVFVLVTLVLLRQTPFLANIVNYEYIPYTSIRQATFDYIDLGYRNTTAQIMLSVVALIGAVAALSRKKYRWPIFSYVFFGIAYLSAAGTEHGFFGTFFSGFWYNDVDRIAACATFVLIPYAALGLYAINRTIRIFIQKTCIKCDVRVIEAAFLILFVAIVFRPNHILAGMGDINTAFGTREDQLSTLATTRKSLTSEEEAFAEQCKELIGGDTSKIINFPFDGSVYTYTTSGLNLTSRHYFSATNGDLEIVQKKLANIADDKEVQDAVKRIDAGFLLLLDSNNPSNPSIYDSFLDKSHWEGITQITDNTPGFEVLLSEGDMRLYKITGTIS